MAGTKLGYDFIAVPRRRHAKWRGLAHSAGQFLFPALFEINEGGLIPFDGDDWRVWLCRAWSLAGKARSPICKTLSELQQLGLIAVGEGVISVLFHPNAVHPEEVLAVARRPLADHSAATTRPQLDHNSTTQQPHSGSNAVSHFDLSVGDNSTPKIQTDREKDRKKERETARAPEGNFRRPPPEPPPGFVDTYQEAPKEPSLEERVITLWQGAIQDKGFRKPGSTKRAADSAAEVAKWLGDNVRDGETPLEVFKAALKLYVADETPSLRDNLWPLHWLVDRLPRYLAPKQSAKPVESTNPTHRVWRPYDYEAAQRESYDPERIRKQREEIFAGDPDGLARAEEAEREIGEQIAAERAARKVVPIAEAKPIKRAEPMTEQQRQERIRFLQAQAEQIRAANAAK